MTTARTRDSSPTAAPDVALPTGEDKVRAVRAMFDTIAPRYELLNGVITFGLDRRWRRQAVRALHLPPGGVVLDVACGTGELCRDLLAVGQHPIGIDLSGGMLRHARTSAPLVHGDALRLPFPAHSLDGAVSGFALRNFASLEVLFAELARTLRPGGRIVLLDVATPRQALLRAGHRVWFERVVPGLGGLVSDRAAYRYLPRSVAYLPPTDVLVAQVGAAGFRDVEHRFLSGGITQLLSARRGPA